MGDSYVVKQRLNKVREIMKKNKDGYISLYLKIALIQPAFVRHKTKSGMKVLGTSSKYVTPSVEPLPTKVFSLPK